MFVVGFRVVFVLLGLRTTTLGNALFSNQETLTRISGGLVLLMACYLAGSQILTTPTLYQEMRMEAHLLIEGRRREDLRSREVTRHQQHEAARDASECLLVAEQRVAQCGREQTQQHEHHGEPEHEHPGVDRDALEVVRAALLHLADREPGDQTEISRHHWQDARREERDHAPAERSEQIEVAGDV